MVKFELKNLSNAIKKINNEIDSLSHSMIEKRVTSLVEDLETVTPKDTGYAASRWEAEESSFIETVISAIRFKDKPYIVKNDAEYISYLNEGSSTQAPAKFVEQTVLNQGFKPTGSIVTK